MRRVIISDASYNLVNIPDELDLEEQKRLYNKWYNNNYLLTLRQGLKPEYLTFSEWLIKNAGATKMKDIEEFEDD